MKSLNSMGLKIDHEGRLFVLDQTLLPHEETWLECNTPDEMIRLIQRLAIRGAPLIGVAAALSLAQFAEKGANESEFVTAAAKVRASRPTAVNLMWAVDRLTQGLRANGYRREWLVSEAEKIFDEDVALCSAMTERAAAFIQDGDGVLTHCNSGGLATAGIGTALGAIRKAHDQKKRIHVYVDETRPLLQGARLTAWELHKLGIPHTLICDNMAGFLMAQGKVNKIFVGADRIAANGDFANKIGTYSLAVLARFHQIPFYVVAPSTTFDADCPQGSAIPIELRKPDEVRAGRSHPNCEVWNPAFDVTPREIITGIVLDDRMI